MAVRWVVGRVLPRVENWVDVRVGSMVAWKDVM